jgi:hypothetical protein
VVPLLAASLIFAALAWSSPVKVDPNWKFSICDYPTRAETDACNAFELKFAPQIHPAYRAELWFHQSYVEIAEGLAALALLFPLLSVKRLDFTWLHKPFAPWFPRWLFLLLVLVGAGIFGVYAVADSTLAEIPKFSGSVFSWSNKAFGVGYGTIALTMWGLTILALSLHKGFIGSLKIFGFPAILFLTVMLWMFDSRDMIYHVTNFAMWSLRGIDLVSNWFVLVICAGLEGWVVLRGKLR